MIRFEVKIPVQFGCNQFLQQFAVAFDINRFAHLAMVSIAMAAAGLNRQFVVVGQVLCRRYGTAALGIVAGQGNEVDVNHGLLQFLAVGNALMVAVSPRHQFGQFRHMFLKFENKSGTLPVDDADADTEHVFGIDFYLMFVNQFHQFRIVVDGGGQLVVITLAAKRELQLVIVLQNGPMLICQHVHIFVILQQSLSLPAKIVLKVIVGRIMGGNLQLIGRFGKGIGKIFGIVNRF